MAALTVAASVAGAGCSVIFDPSDLARGTSGSTSASSSTSGAQSSSQASSGSGLASCEGETCSGRGTCDTSSGTPTCVCNDRFAGPRCEDCSAPYRGPACAACAVGYQDANEDGTCEPACADGMCSANGVCSDASGTPTCVCDARFTGASCETRCPDGTAGDGCAFRLVYALDVPVAPIWRAVGDVVYQEDASSTAGAFSRVGYRLVLDDEQVWVELDPFTDVAAELGIPVDWVFDVPVTGVVVRSLSPNQPSLPEPVTGNVEMWSHCYSAGADGLYDAHDVRNDMQPDCYGSFQVHALDTPVVSVNAWANDSTLDLGIGPSPNTNPDWTFQGNAGSFSTRRLEIYVK